MKLDASSDGFEDVEGIARFMNDVIVENQVYEKLFSWFYKVRMYRRLRESCLIEFRIMDNKQGELQ